MKTIVWKELREHARWVPLGFVPLVVLLVVQWNSGRLVFDGEGELFSLVGPLAASIAAALGLLQTLPDQRPAARALLLQRGVTTGAVFAGKLLAGAVLYAAATLVPLSGMAVYIALVGIEHRAASPGALLPSVYVTILAFCLWFVAFLIVYREARFWGSRLLPAATGVLAALFGALLFTEGGAASAGRAWSADGVAALTLVVFGIAAAGAFSNRGKIVSSCGRGTLGLIVVVALLTGALFLAMTLESYRREYVLARPGAKYYYLVRLGPDGRPWLTRGYYDWRSGGYQIDQSAALDREEPVRDRLEPIGEDWEALAEFSPTRSTLSYFPGRFVGRGRRFVHIASSTIPAAGARRREWVFDSWNQSLLVYRLLAQTRRRWQLERRLRPATGSFGRLLRWGQTDQDGNFTLIAAKGVYRVPGDASSVETVYRVPADTQLIGFETAHRQDEALAVVLRLPDRVVLLESDPPAGAEQDAQDLGGFRGIDAVYATEVRLPDELATADAITLARDPRRAGGMLGVVSLDPWEGTELAWLRFDQRGQIQERAEYWADYSPSSVYEAMLVHAFIPPAPLAVGIAVTLCVNDAATATWASFWDDSRKAALTVLLLLVQPLVGVPVAMWAARRRRLEGARRRAWIWWGLLFGPAGGLTILAVFPRIVRLPCPACRAATRIDRAICEHCAQPLDEKARTGVEIFDYDRPAAKPATAEHGGVTA